MVLIWLKTSCFLGSILCVVQTHADPIATSWVFRCLQLAFTLHLTIWNQNWRFSRHEIVKAKLDLRAKYVDLVKRVLPPSWQPRAMTVARLRSRGEESFLRWFRAKLHVVVVCFHQAAVDKLCPFQKRSSVFLLHILKWYFFFNLSLLEQIGLCDSKNIIFASVIDFIMGILSVISKYWKCESPDHKSTVCSGTT